MPRGNRQKILNWPGQAHLKADHVGVLVAPNEHSAVPGRKAYAIYVTWGRDECSTSTRQFLGVAYETPDGPQFESAASLNRDESAGI